MQRYKKTSMLKRKGYISPTVEVMKFNHATIRKISKKWVSTYFKQVIIKFICCFLYSISGLKKHFSNISSHGHRLTSPQKKKPQVCSFVAVIFEYHGLCTEKAESRKTIITTLELVKLNPFLLWFLEA